MSTPVEGGLRDALSGQYEIEREIGRGGMGVVYLARDVRLDRPVAIKLLSPDQNDEPAAHERFLREARTAASLSHPNIVSIYREDEINGRTFFVMQYVNGASLGERVRDLGPVPPVAATRWLRDVALALGYAHSLGVIHRDIKPENILIDGVSQKAMVADFGIARVAQASRLTSTDQVLGSVHFMSPEQITNEPLDGRGDLYSLGAVAFFALSGVLPFPSSAAGAVLVAHVTSPPPPLLSVAPNTPRALAAVVDRCLRKDPGQRYQTGEELAGALEAATVEDFDPDSAIIAESDAARLWKRASELQADAAKRGAISGDVPLNSVPLLRRRLAADGYRLSDAKAAAVEAGISAQYVALALDEIRASPPVAQSAPASTATERSHSRIAGAPMQIEREVTVDREVASDEFEFLVDTIQRSFGDIGQVSTLGRSLLWSSQGQQRKLQVSVVPRHGRTTIRIT
ncbi:MAG: protein kinase, partial [Gemmatimonadales bacterium]